MTDSKYTLTSQNNTPRVILLSAIAAIGGFLFGFDSGVINGAVHALQVEFDSDAIGTGFNVASMLLGCAVGAFFAGSLADRFGRKTILLITAGTFIVSAWGSGISASSAEFVFYRILGGLAVGSASILAPAYISEIAPPHIRGRLASLQQLMIVLGLVSAFFSNYLIAGVAGGATELFWAGFKAWQWMFWVEIVPALVFLFGLIFIPESPRYLVAAGKAHKAETILAKLTNLEQAKKIVGEIKDTVFEKRKPRFTDIYRPERKNLYPIVWIGMALAMLQQFTGINVVFYYGAVLWQAAGFTEADALLTNVINGSVNVLFTFVAIALIDKVGRKPLLLVGALGQAVMLAVMAITFSVGDVTPEGNLNLSAAQGLIALVAANLFIAFFAFSWGPVMWVMLGEMFPNRFRGAALAVCGLAQWGANFLITMSFPIFLATIGLGLSYGIYATFGFIAFIFVKRFITETKDKTLEQMSKEHEELNKISLGN